MITIRRADVRDVEPLGQIINDCAEYGLMLHRPLAGLYERVRDFRVAVRDQADGGERVVGVCGLTVIWGDLAEVASLAVAPEARGRGLGKRLVAACLDDARQLGIRRVMSLTYERQFFEKLGFHVVDRQSLPLKVWSECVHCPKNQHCDEIAMIRVLDDVPELSAPRPQAPPADKYIVPVTLSGRAAGGGPHAAGPR